jgi:hypothetical protein
MTQRIRIDGNFSGVNVYIEDGQVRVYCLGSKWFGRDKEFVIEQRGPNDSNLTNFSKTLLVEDGKTHKMISRRFKLDHLGRN